MMSRDDGIVSKGGINLLMRRVSRNVVTTSGEVFMICYSCRSSGWVPLYRFLLVIDFCLV